jgi:hypothetical protein
VFVFRKAMLGAAVIGMLMSGSGQLVFAEDYGKVKPVTPQSNTTKHVAPVGQKVSGPNGGEVSEAAKISDAYAAHLYTSICVREHQYQFPLRKMEGPKKAQFFDLAQKACKCMAEEMIKASSGPNLVDFVMYFYGKKPTPDHFSPEAKAYLSTNLYFEIADVQEDPAILKKCGFTE